MIHALSSDASCRDFFRRRRSFLKIVSGYRSSEPKIDGMMNATGPSLLEIVHYESRAMRMASIDRAMDFSRNVSRRFLTVGPRIATSPFLSVDRPALQSPRRPQRKRHMQLTIFVRKCGGGS